MAARRLGVDQTLLRSWKMKFQEQGDQAFPGAGQRMAIEEESCFSSDCGDYWISGVAPVGGWVAVAFGFVWSVAVLPAATCAFAGSAISRFLKKGLKPFSK